MGRNPLMDGMSPWLFPQSPSKGFGGQKNIFGLILSDLRKFAQTMSPERAEKEIIRLLGAGEMTREQFAELKQDAEFWLGFLK